MHAALWLRVPHAVRTTPVPCGRLQMPLSACQSQAQGHGVKLFKRKKCACGKAREHCFIHEPTAQ